MTDKTFAVAGVSKLNGKFRARFAKDMMRVKVLDKAGHTDVNLVELPEPMTKAAAASHLIDINFDAGNAEIRDALYAEIDRGSGVKKSKAAPAAAEAGSEDTVAEVPAEVIERAHEIAADMKPAAVRGPGGRFVKQTSPAAEAFQSWAEAANAEEEEADIEF